jgi:hypothetical protein
MGSPIDGPEKYAPKWVRDSNRETSHENPSTTEGRVPPAQPTVCSKGRLNPRSGSSPSSASYGLFRRGAACFPRLETPPGERTSRR